MQTIIIKKSNFLLMIFFILSPDLFQACFVFTHFDQFFFEAFFLSQFLRIFFLLTIQFFHCFFVQIGSFGLCSQNCFFCTPFFYFFVISVQAFKKATVAYDAGYDTNAVEQAAVATADGLQKLIDEKAAAGFRKLVLLPGVYRVSWSRRLRIPDRFTLDLGGATLKLNACSVASVVMVNLASTVDSHLVGGTLEGDYWAHDYKGAPSGSEWVSGFEIGGDSWYSSVEGVTVRDITGYGGQNGIAKDAKGDLAFFCDWFPAYAPGGLDPKSGEVDTNDCCRFTTDFKDIKKIAGKGFRRLQVSKYLGYQGVATRSWQLTAAWYDAEKNFISAETCWQYREMWIPEQAAFIRISVEAESAEAAKKADLKLVAFRIPVNCAVKNCRFANLGEYVFRSGLNPTFVGNSVTNCVRLVYPLKAAWCDFTFVSNRLVNCGTFKTTVPNWNELQKGVFAYNIFVTENGTPFITKGAHGLTDKDVYIHHNTVIGGPLISVLNSTVSWVPRIFDNIVSSPAPDGNVITETGTAFASGNFSSFKTDGGAFFRNNAYSAAALNGGSATEVSGYDLSKGLLVEDNFILAAAPEFMSTDPTSPNFYRPKQSKNPTWIGKDKAWTDGDKYPDYIGAVEPIIANGFFIYFR